MTTTTYVDSGGVSANVQRRPPSASSSTEVLAELLSTVHVSGALTTKPWTALRSGWSKFAHAIRAKSHSKLVQR